MKIKLLKPVELKALTIGLGLSVGFLVMSFLIPHYSARINKDRHPVRKTVSVSQPDKQYSEVRGMN